MSNTTSIGWTRSDDGAKGRSWNPISGCSKVSPGCEQCYAEALSHRFGWTTKPWTAPHAAENVQLHPDRLDHPLRWQKPHRIFVNSISDVFHTQVPDAFLDQIFAVMALASQHTFQILTKRPERMYAYLTDPNTPRRIAEVVLSRNPVAPDQGVRSIELSNRTLWPLPNVWLGVSVEDQRRAEERIPWLQQTPAAIRFLSCEPLLAPLDLTAYLPHRSVYDPHIDLGGCALCGHLPSWHGTDIAWVDWVIVGAESGSQARPMDDDWVRTLRDQCQTAGTAFFFKQRTGRGGYKDVDPVLDGRQWLEFPLPRHIGKHSMGG